MSTMKGNYHCVHVYNPYCMCLAGNLYKRCHHDIVPYASFGVCTLPHGCGVM